MRSSLKPKRLVSSSEFRLGPPMSTPSTATAVIIAAATLVSGILVSGCGSGDSTATSPSRTSTPLASHLSAQSPSPPSAQPPSPPSAPATVTITFSGLTAGTDDGAVGPAVTAYTEAGFTVTATSGSWTVDAYGNPGPSIVFWAEAGTTVAGAIQVTAAAAPFGFKSVDLYASTTPIPYTITGLRNGMTVFTMAATQRNTFGDFATVVNSQTASLIDALVISLSNAAAPCCRNPMGLDNIVLTR